MAGHGNTAEIDQSFKPDAVVNQPESFSKFLTDIYTPKPGQDQTYYSQAINDMTKSDSTTKLVNDLFGDPSKILGDHNAKGSHDDYFTAKLVEAMTPTPRTAAERAEDIKQSDEAAAAADSVTVVDSSDLGRLMAARGALGNSKAEQLAAARIDSSIGSVQQKLAAQEKNTSMGGNLTDAEAQTCLNPDQVKHTLEQKSPAV